jgi:hypothetical protein
MLVIYHAGFTLGYGAYVKGLPTQDVLFDWPSGLPCNTSVWIVPGTLED